MEWVKNIPKDAQCKVTELISDAHLQHQSLPSPLVHTIKPNLAWADDSDGTLVRLP